MKSITNVLGRLVFASRWILYPVNLGLLLVLALYVCQFLIEDFHFLFSGDHGSIEKMMVTLLGFVDASMVANLIIMIVQGSHQIFIQKFQLTDSSKIPQYLDHIDSGILKVKVAISIASITLVHILKDFMNLEEVDWGIAVHRIVIHGVALSSALVMAIIWRVMHPSQDHSGKEHKEHA